MITKLFFTSLAILLPAAQALAQNSYGSADLNPLGRIEGPQELYGRFLQFFLGFVGVGALGYFIIGGIILLMSQGNPEKVKMGKDTLVWAIIGMFVAFASYIILRFVLEIIITPTGA
ncbi:MAG: hypothetical protein HYT31_04785 [Parcubacteria group bacterium]|nr:hypothetical protein [Parcubacteria group bacterium]